MPTSKKSRPRPANRSVPDRNDRRRLLLKGLVEAFRTKVRTYQAWQGQRTEEAPTADDQAREAAFQQAEAAFEGQLTAALARGQLGPTLFAAAAGKDLPEELAHALHDHLARRAQSQILETPEGPVEGTLLGLVVQAHDPEAWPPEQWLETLTTALDAAIDGPLQVRAFPGLIHPLTWGQMILDQRLAVFDELAQGTVGPGHAALLRQQDEQTKPNAPFASAVRLQLVWLGSPPQEEDPAEHRLRRSLMLPAWGKFKAAVRSDDAWAESPLAIEDALAYSLLHHLRAKQAQEVDDPRTIRLLKIEEVPRQPLLRLAFGAGDRALTTRTVPFPWMGTTRQSMENTLAQLSTGWA